MVVYMKRRVTSPRESETFSLSKFKFCSHCGVNEMLGVVCKSFGFNLDKFSHFCVGSF